jgi:hypothetical protein
MTGFVFTLEAIISPVSEGAIAKRDRMCAATENLELIFLIRFTLSL